MRGRYYLKHTINHTVDNNQKIKKLNENYETVINNNASEYLRNSQPSTNEKVAYLKSF